MIRTDAIVIGAGVVGIAVARALARSGRETIVLEAEDGIAQHASSRNSEVVHAGIYYPPGSLKARTCIDGRTRLLAYCDAHGIALRRCGKLIVATDPAERARLEELHARAAACGVTLTWLDGDEIRRREPEVAAIGGLWSPGTAVVDSHGFVHRLWRDAEAAGAALARGTRFVAAEPSSDGLRVHTRDEVIACDVLVNAAGRDAPACARAIAAVPPTTIPGSWLAKGSYFALRGPLALSHLVYPMPVPGGLGIHVTLDIAGAIRLGPDVEWTDTASAHVDPSRAEVFAEAARRYLPRLQTAWLQPAYAGFRAKISGPGEPARDFEVQGPAVHGVAGLVQMFGIESPGLTASLSLARHVLALLDLPVPTDL